ncbi:hypothetical protein ACFCWG_11660 [Streptomyces sp. NPDC056390]|uniref:hypothetical protein n=1 Tax=Streptomyces sp. NPDC056390 TaxID=3345806 RepID=UPI0035DA2882
MATADEQHDGDRHPVQQALTTDSAARARCCLAGSAVKAAVVSNAAWHACGVRVRDLPTTLDKVLRALEERPAW